MTWERFAKGRTLVGVDEDDEDFASAGLELGEKEHQLTVDEMPSHTHPITGLKNVFAPKGSYNNLIYFSGSLTSGSAGDDQPHNNIQPSTTVYYWRRVS